MQQLYRMGPTNAPAPTPPRKNESTWSVILGLVVACLCIAAIMGALAVTGLLKQVGPAPSPLTTSVGQSLTIHNVTVTLTSASVTINGQVVQPAGQDATPEASGQAMQGVVMSLHFVNPTGQAQSVSMTSWKLLDQGINSYSLLPTTGSLQVNLAPNATADQQIMAPLGANSESPYTLLTDVTTSANQTLGWEFSG